MNGFFTRKELQLKSEHTNSCSSCKLRKDIESPMMQPFGKFKKRILNVGEAPGADEDKRGRQWQGVTGRLLQQTYKRLNIDLFEDCLNINAVNCRPVDKDFKNRQPTNEEIKRCRSTVLKVIEERKPHLVILLGSSAVQSVIGHRFSRDIGTISKWRGFAIPDRDFNCWVCPTFHPSYVERSDSLEVETIFEQDLQNAFDHVNKEMNEYIEPDIEYIDKLHIFDDLDIKRISVDFETTGIKPHADGHRIICASIAISSNKVFSFMMPNTRAKRRPLLRLLADPRVEKMAHNIKFEDNWSEVRLGLKVNNWYWDSMIAAHIFDNRPGITNLKFQTYVNFGIADYSSEIESYISSNSKDGNALNKMKLLAETAQGREKMLKYCALDSIYQYRLATKQMQLINYDQLPF